MGRTYKKRRSSKNSIIGDSAYIGSKLPWYGALFFGAVTFILFYYIVPDLLYANITTTQSSYLYPAVEVIIGNRIHWFQRAGVACALIFVYFAVRNYLTSRASSGTERSVVGLISRILGRNID